MLAQLVNLLQYTAGSESISICGTLEAASDCLPVSNFLFMKKTILLFLLFANVMVGFCQINSTYKWTWIGGENGVGSFGVYGQKGIEAATNKPGARGFFTAG